MPAPLAWITGTIISHVIAALIFKVLTALGVGFVTYVGVSALIDGAFNEIESMTSSLPVEVIQVLITLRIDDAITVLASAVAIRLSLKTFGVGGQIRQLQFGMPQPAP